MPNRHEGSTRGPDPEQLDALASAVRELTQRVAELEARLPPAEPKEPEPFATWTPPARKAESTDSGRRGVKSTQDVSAFFRIPPEQQAKASASKATPRDKPTWAIGPLARVERESLPVVIMGAAGGVAILVGALYFAWLSVQQGWLSPTTRLVCVAAFGVLAMALAWRLAPRGHVSVASALGGAGLGSWFAAALVGRHAYDLLDPTQTFVALVVGAAAGLAIASHRRLRFLALLAALGAFATPLSIGSSSGSIHQLLGYQLVSVVLLCALEDRRKWPELGHFAVFGTWVLAGAWASDPQNSIQGAALTTWACIYLVLGHLHAWNAVRRGRTHAAHAAPRVAVNAFAAWAFGAIGITAVLDSPLEDRALALLALGMAVWNGAIAFALWRANVGSTTKPRLIGRIAMLFGCASAAWLQLLAVGPLYWANDGAIVWWSAMAIAAAALHVRSPGLRIAVPFFLPFAAVLGAYGHRSDGVAPFAFLVASLPIWMALWPSGADAERRRAFDSYLAAALFIGALAWRSIAASHFSRFEHGPEIVVAVCALACVPSALRTVRSPSPARCATMLACLVGVVLLALATALDGGLFQPRASASLTAERAWLVVSLGVVAGLAFMISASFRRRMGGDEWSPRIHDSAGLVRPLALLALSALLVSQVVPLMTNDTANARSLNQAGWSVCLAAAGLILIVRGLFARRTAWRGAGMLVLLVTSAKILAVDLVHVSTLWRVMSFVGLGACLLLGAYAYRRLGSRIETETVA